MEDGAGSEGVSMGSVSKKVEPERDQVWQEQNLRWQPPGQCL